MIEIKNRSGSCRGEGLIREAPGFLRQETFVCGTMVVDSCHHELSILIDLNSNEYKLNII